MSNENNAKNSQTSWRSKIIKVLSQHNDLFENVKNIVEAIAFIVAGCWTYYYFKTTEGPSLTKALSVEGKIHIDSLLEDKCMLVYTTTIKNISKSEVTVDRVEAEYWLIPMDSILAYREFKADWYWNNHRREDFDTPTLAGIYTPKMCSYDASNFIFSKAPNYAILCQCTVYGHEYQWFFWRKEYHWTAYDMKPHALPDIEKKENSDDNDTDD